MTECISDILRRNENALKVVNDSAERRIAKIKIIITNRVKKKGKKTYLG